MTPNDVVATLGLVPLFAALWALSNRLSALVSVLAVVLFALVVLEETRNRPTLLYFGAAAVVISIVLRLYATSMANVLSTRGPRSPGSPGAGMPRTRRDLHSTLPGVHDLSRRELEVAQLASQGYMASEIGVRLNISRRTVESHIANAYSKLGVNSRPALIRISGALSDGAGSSIDTPR